MDARLREHNRRIYAWANRQPTKTHRKVALAIGLRTNAESLSATYALETMARRSYGKNKVIRQTIARYLPDFEATGAITVYRSSVHDAQGRLAPNTYHVHLDRVAADQVRGERAAKMSRARRLKKAQKKQASLGPAAVNDQVDEDESDIYEWLDQQDSERTRQREAESPEAETPKWFYRSPLEDHIDPECETCGKRHDPWTTCDEASSQTTPDW
jgi:hypothetical protein